jgi:trehalose 6-phosphate phosphatase
MPLSGQHGVEWRDADGLHVNSQMDVGALAMARAHLLSAIARHPELLLEDKGFTLALHYRQAPTLAAYAHRLMHAARERAGNDFAVQRGKCVVELKPVATDKGVAVRQLMAWPAFARRTPVFVGDDITDEDGFAAVNELGGHSIKIGGGHTVARWRLRSVSQLMAWLARAA